MSNRIFVKPVPGTKVRLPDTGKHIPDAGCWVEQTSYIVRRIAEKSLVVLENPQPAVKKADKGGDK